MANEGKNVFISHHGKDDEYVRKFQDLLDRKGFSIKNSSIDSTKPNDATNEEYIKGILRSRIDWGSTLVVLIGENTHNRDWVNWEIEYADKMGKRIIGVYLPGATGEQVPEAFEKYGHSLKGWRSESIIEAIEGDCDDLFENPDGTPRPAPEGNRGNC